MSSQMKRREFVKMLLGLGAWFVMPGEQPGTRATTQAHTPSAPNVLILVFDAFSALHADIHGYPRRTTVNLRQYAGRATVYHRHYAAGNFTSPGTTSLLTGTYPWTHRVMQGFDSVGKDFVHNSVFGAFAAGGHYRVGYSHNLLATALLHSFRHDLDVFTPTRELCLLDNQLADLLFREDYNVAVWQEQLFRGVEPAMPTSLLYYLLSRRIWSVRLGRLETQYKDRFPRGLPRVFDQVFLLEDAIDWVIDGINTLPQPFMAYLHLGPPHYPYSPRREFVDMFDDGWQPMSKVPHFFSQGESEEELNAKRREYDQHIAYADAEFGRLVRALAENGVLDNTYVVVTSDHGEMFERGIWEHWTPTLYEPIVRVPLLISRPGQQQREDIHVPTSSVDLLPTLLHATGQPVPAWCEGAVLPPLGNEKAFEQRSVYIVEAKENHKHGPLTRATVAMVKGHHKLIHYFGYPGHEDEYEFYDLANDPEEVNNLYAGKGMPVKELQDELQRRIERANEPYPDRA